MKVEARMEIIDKGQLMAMGTVTIDGILQIGGVKVLSLQGREKVLVALPRKKMPDGTWKSVIEIQDPAVREEIDAVVCREVYAAVKRWPYSKDIQADIRLCHPGGKVSAYATVRYKGIEITGVQVIDGQDGIQVRFPYDIVNGKAKSLIAPVGKNIQECFVHRIVESYQEARQLEAGREERGMSR